MTYSNLHCSVAIAIKVTPWPAPLSGEVIVARHRVSVNGDRHMRGGLRRRGKR